MIKEASPAQGLRILEMFSARSQGLDSQLSYLLVLMHTSELCNQCNINVLTNKPQKGFMLQMLSTLYASHGTTKVV